MSVTRSQITFGALVGLFSAVVSALSSVVTLQARISGVAGDITNEVRTSVKRDFAPVGTIVASHLMPSKFAEITGENLGDDITKRSWVLADGSLVRGSAFAKATGNQPVPDLRGMFIRGLNPEEARSAGTLEEYATALPKTQRFAGEALSGGTHSHDGGMGLITNEKYNVGGSNYTAAGQAKTADSGTHSHEVTINKEGDNETRPRNVGAYYYIKIN